MHRPILLLVTTLLGVSSILAAMASVSIESAATVTASVQEDITTVRRYYDALNDMIATGDPALLREVVHPELIDLEPPASGPEGLDAIEAHARYLHEVFPQARIEAESVAGNGAEVLARVVVHLDSPAMPLGFALESPSSLWPSAEKFLVHNGRIVERSGSWQPVTTLRTVAHHRIDLDPAVRRVLEVSRFIYEPGATGRLISAEMPMLIRVAHGNLAFTLSGTTAESAHIAYPSTGAGDSPRQIVNPGESVPLEEGAVVTVSRGTGVTLRNAGETRATIIRIAIGLPQDNHPKSDAGGNHLTPGVRVETILEFPTGELARDARLALGAASFVPGSSLVVAPSTNLMLLMSESGEVHTLAKPGRCGAHVGFGTSASSDLSGMVVLHMSCTDASERIVVMNAGAEPATMWVLSVATDGTNRPASPASG
jgi:SnoaL-like protein